MLRKSYVFLLVTLLSSLAVFAQDAPKPEKLTKPGEKQLQRAYSFSFSGGGGYLGVHMREITNENFSKYGLNGVRGVGVEKVVKGSPADEAGVKDGDVIIRFDGESVTSVRKLNRLITEVAPDHKVAITVIRKGNEQDLNATIGKRKSISFANTGGRISALGLPGIPEFPVSPDDPRVRVLPMPKGKNRVPLVWRMSSSRTIGVTVTTLTDQLRDFFGVEKGAGLLVKSVKTDSAAYTAGLKAGDVITKIDGKSVSNTFDISRALSAKKEGTVDLTFVRDKKSKTVEVTPEKREISPIREFDFPAPKTVNK